MKNNMKQDIMEIAYSGDIVAPDVLYQVALRFGMKIINRILKEHDLVISQFWPDRPSREDAATRSSRENWLERQLYFWLDGQQELLLGKRGRWDVRFKCVEMPDAVYIFQRQPAR